MNYDTQYLQRCRELIEEKSGWPPAGEWRNFEFTELSDKIFDATGVQLSTTTLKRIFGKVRYESLPSSATLNALTRYLGYENWMAFKTEQENNKKEETPAIAVTSIPPIKKGRALSKKTLITAVASLLMIAIFGSMLLSGSSSSSATLPKNIVFKSRPLAEGLPNSVVFNFDLKGIKSEDVIIQQSWDSTKTIRVKADQSEATGIYYVPGYFRAKLIVDKKIVQEHDLFIRANDWMATIDYGPVPTYLKNEQLVLNQGMNIPSQALEEIKKAKVPTTLTYHLVRPFENLHSDNFTLETGFQNTLGEGPAVCRTSKVFVLCTNAAFIIPFTIPGCVSDVNLKLADKTWEGKSNDLSVFGIDPANKINLRLEVKNRAVKIFCNGKLIREAFYEKDAGDIVGLRYSFLGSGTVDHIKLLNEKAEPVYTNDFQK